MRDSWQPCVHTAQHTVCKVLNYICVAVRPVLALKHIYIQPHFKTVSVLKRLSEFEVCRDMSFNGETFVFVLWPLQIISAYISVIDFQI